MRTLILAVISARWLLAQITISPLPANLPVAAAYESYSQQFAASRGTGPYAWSCTAGCTSTSSSDITTLSAYPSSPGSPTYFQWNSGTATVSGVPDGCASFDYPIASFAPCTTAIPEPITLGSFTIMVQDSLGATATQTYTLTMNWNPSQATFLSQQDANFAAMIQQIGAATLPPKPKFGALHEISNPKLRNQHYDSQNPWNAWVDAMNAAGVKVMWIYPDVDCFIGVRNTPTGGCIGLYSGIISRAHGYGMSVRLSPGYYQTQSCGNPGCPGGVAPIVGPTHGLLDACNNYYPSSPGIVINGSSIGPSPGPYPNGITSGVQDWYNCLTTPISGLSVVPGGCNPCSVYEYLATGMGLHAGDMIVGPHEPTTQAALWREGTASTGCSNTATAPTVYQCNGGSTPGGMPTGNTCPRDWVDHFANPWYTYMMGITGLPMGLLLGASVDYSPEMDTQQMDTGTPAMCSSQTYAECFAAQLNSSIYIGSDLYVWTNGSKYGSPGTSTPDYTSCSGTCTVSNGTYPYTAQYVQQNNHVWYVQEVGPPDWVVYNAQTNLIAPTISACQVAGALNCTWLTFHQNFLAASYSYLAGLGAESVSLFDAALFAQCVPLNSTSTPDNELTIQALINATNAMLNHQYSATLVGRMAALASQWGKSAAAGGQWQGQRP